MQAYLNDPKLKERFLKEIAKHEKADAIIKGRYTNDCEGKSFKGCAVGCSLQSMNKILKKDESVSSHARFEPELGIPEVLARLEDRIFEGLPVEESKTWPRRFSEAVNVGADLSLVWPKLAIWMLVDETDGVIRLAVGRKDVEDAILRVAALYKDKYIDGKAVSDEMFAVASQQALDATASASADAYADAAAADAAKQKYFVRMSEKLIELLRLAGAGEK